MVDLAVQGTRGRRTGGRLVTDCLGEGESCRLCKLIEMPQTGATPPVMEVIPARTE